MNLYVLLSILVSVTMTGCRPSAMPGTQQPVYRKLSAQEAKAQLEADRTIKLVDVRTEAEYREKRLANSLLVPNDEIEKLAPTLLPKKDEKLFLYCRSGRRSRDAAHKLLKMGYTNVYDIGGIIDWPYETVSGK